jgi:DNA-directed RNA polymerase subunit RPC12/RpoP
MPIYHFKCLKCSEVYDELTVYDETGKYRSVKCPNCKSKQKEKTYDYDVTCTFSNPKESSKWDNFGYRAGHNMEKAKADRRAAEAVSHMGTDPYNHSRLKD